MHSLEVIIYRNEKAAGRELAHRVNDNGASLAIFAEHRPDWLDQGEEWVAFMEGWAQGRREG